MISKKLLIILLSILVITGIGISIFYINKKITSPAQQIVPGPDSSFSMTQKIEYMERQYIDGVWKVRERVQDCGGGKPCLDYLVIELPKDMRTEDIWTVRVNMDDCVDETLQTGDMVRVRGNIEKVIPDFGLVLSCHSSKTSIIKN